MKNSISLLYHNTSNHSTLTNKSLSLAIGFHLKTKYWNHIWSVVSMDSNRNSKIRRTVVFASWLIRIFWAVTIKNSWRQHQSRHSETKLNLISNHFIGKEWHFVDYTLPCQCAIGSRVATSTKYFHYSIGKWWLWQQTIQSGLIPIPIIHCQTDNEINVYLYSCVNLPIHPVVRIAHDVWHHVPS